MKYTTEMGQEISKCITHSRERQRTKQYFYSAGRRRLRLAFFFRRERAQATKFSAQLHRACNSVTRKDGSGCREAWVKPDPARLGSPSAMISAIEPLGTLAARADKACQSRKSFAHGLFSPARLARCRDTVHKKKKKKKDIQCHALQRRLDVRWRINTRMQNEHHFFGCN